MYRSQHSNESPRHHAYRGKKVRLALLVSVGLSILVLVAALTIILIAKTTADAVARDSRPKDTAYIEAVVTAAESSNQPTRMVTAVQAVDVPEFAHIPLGSLSNDYTSAKRRHEDVISRVDDFTKKLIGYGETLAFYETYDELTAKLAALDVSTSVSQAKTKDLTYLTQRYELLKEVNELIEKTTITSEYSTEFVELGRVYDSMESNMEVVTTALEQNNLPAYDTAYGLYSMAAAQVPRVETVLSGYVDTIPAKVSAARDALKTYRNGLQ